MRNILLLSGLIALSACTSAGSDADLGRVDVYTDPAEHFHARVGQDFDVMLPGNRTTGYVWRLAQAPEADVVKLVGEAYNAVPGGRVGSGGEQVFHFRATGVGMARLEFEYLRPWETASPAKRAVWTAIVIGAR